MTSKAKDLINLAAKQFKLSDPERKLLRRVIDGEQADYSLDPSRTLRASLIVWLCTVREACSYLTHLGLSIKGAKIEGQLKLSFTILEFPLSFLNCAFTEKILLDRAKVNQMICEKN